jgi:hypothetical protein
MQVLRAVSGGFNIVPADSRFLSRWGVGWPLANHQIWALTSLICRRRRLAGSRSLCLLNALLDHSTDPVSLLKSDFLARRLFVTIAVPSCRRACSISLSALSLTVCHSPLGDIRTDRRLWLWWRNGAPHAEVTTSTV